MENFDGLDNRTKMEERRGDNTMSGPLLLIGNWVNQITSNFHITHLVRSVLKLAELDTRTPSEFLLKHFKLLGKKG